MTETNNKFTPGLPPNHLSYSQATTLLDCGEKYRLTRIFHVPDPSGWALVGGKAFHRATEEYDLAVVRLAAGDEEWRNLNKPRGIVATESKTSDVEASGGDQDGREDNATASAETGETVQDLEPTIRATAWDAAQAVREFGADAAQPHLATLVDLTLRDELRQQARSTGQSERAVAESLRVSGRKSAAWPERENRSWWEHHLPLFIHDYVVWRKESGYRLAYLNGKPAIEMDVSGTFGGIGIKAYLDRVMLHPTSVEPCVIDIKSSSREPSNPEQLGIYAALLEANGAPRPRFGAYWMARKGELGQVHDLSKYTAEYFEWKYGILKRQRDAGELIANPASAFCSSCPVRDYCYAVGGSKADQVPRPWETKQEVSN